MDTDRGQLQTAVGKNADGGWMLDLLVKKGWEVVWTRGCYVSMTKKSVSLLQPSLQNQLSEAGKGNQRGQFHE